MLTSSSRGASRILGTGMALPGEAIPNRVIEDLFGQERGRIEERIGIKTRYWSVDLETGRPYPGCRNSELAARAVRAALETAEVSPQEVDLLVVATASPDYALPAVAPLMQDLLGITECVALDVRAACTGFLQALYVASHALECGTAQTACVVGSETPSLLLNYDSRAPYTDKTDFVNAAIFGDGAGAVVLRASHAEDAYKPRLGAIRLGSVGTGRDPGILIGGSGSAEPTSEASVRAGLHRVRQDYRQVLAAGPSLYELAIRKVLEAENAIPNDIGLAIPHQANGQLRQIAAQLFGEVGARFFVNVESVGNCGAASVPIALDEAIRTTPPRSGDLVILVAGEASKWLYGAAAIRW